MARPSGGSSSLPPPFPDLGVSLSAADLRDAAYEVLLAASRTTAAKPLTYTPQAFPSPSSISSSSSFPPPLQHSLTSSAASKMRRALGFTSSASPMGGIPGNAAARRPETVGDLVRAKMGVSERADGRLRRGLLRIAAGQLGRRAESMVLPLEFLQQFKASDFPDPEEYQAWQSRNLKLLEAGLLLHPLVPLNASDSAAQRLQQVIGGAHDRPLETGRNSESMQALRSAVMSLAGRSPDGTSDGCHWADGFPFNHHLYRMLVEACFDVEDGAVVDELDELMELFKKTWVIFGINKMIHNLCFTWVLFNHFALLGQVDMELLSAAKNQLDEVAKDAETTKDADYCKVLSCTLSSIMDWTEKRLLAYHETFNASNIEAMQGIVSIGVTAAKLLVEDISHEYRPRRKEETVDVARVRVDTYIRSSLRTAFAQRMEEVDSKRSSKNPTPVLLILANDIGGLAIKEKNLYSPILREWHPLASGVAVATLHSCFGNELKQYIAGLTELTSDVIQVLKAADKLEKDLVHIAVEDSVDSHDGGKSLIKEMPPYEAEIIMSNLVKMWIKERVDRLKGWIDKNWQQETWNPRANKESVSPSSVEILRIIDETSDTFFRFPIPMHPALLPDLAAALDKCLQYYVSRAKSGCGTRASFIPQLPQLTRCEVGSKLFKKKEKPQKRGLQVISTNGNDTLGLPQICVRLNTLCYIQSELENIEKKMKARLRNVESAQTDITYGLNISFAHSQAACREGIQQLCETTAYKVIFHHLSHVLWDKLYLGDPSSNRVEPFLREIKNVLKTVSGMVHDRVQNRVMMIALMKASFDGFLLVLLAGGPLRAFTCQDSRIVEDDFKALRGLYLSDGSGLPEEVVDKASSEVKNILPLLKTDTETLVERFKRATSAGSGPVAKSGLPLLATQHQCQWSPDDPNTILRVLCHRNDKAATKFLKKAYNLPKKV